MRLTGAGTRAFCVGGDVKQRAETGNYGPTSNGLFEATYLHRLIRDVPKRVIAAVNGLAIGGGHVLHVLCDLSIAADHAKFGQAGPRVGSFDGGFGSAYLARVVGEKRAREIWFLLEQYSAEQAERWGGSPTSPPTRSSTDPDFKNPYPERSWSPHPAGRVRHRLSACLLPAQFGHAFGAPAGPAGTQAGPSAAAGRAQPGQPGGVGQQLGDAAAARHRNDGPDPPAGQSKPFPRPDVRRLGWHGTHDSILPYGSAFERCAHFGVQVPAPR